MKTSLDTYALHLVDVLIEGQSFHFNRIIIIIPCVEFLHLYIFYLFHRHLWALFDLILAGHLSIKDTGCWICCETHIFHLFVIWLFGTVCLPSTNIIFCTCFCLLSDSEKQTPLDETIPTRRHVSSTNQNWRSYWSLTKPKSGC